MQLIIAEKPLVGKVLAQGIGGAKKANGYYECAGGRVVTWCIGHLLEQAPPEAYDPALKKWRADTLPFVPHKWKLLPKAKTKAQFNIVKGLVGKASEIVHAGDPDREGQLLVDELLEHVGNKAPVKRLLLAAVDERSVQRALSGFKDNRDFAPLKESALARQRADWLFGINVTRAITLAAQKYGVRGVVSAGRVQSPTVTLVVDRDREIENFVEKDYYVPFIVAKHNKGEFKAVWMVPEDSPDVDEDGRLLDKRKAETLAQSAKGKQGKLLKADYTQKQTAPPLPHSLSTLQEAASARFGFTSAKTLEVAQSLYDAGITSYPRSDCRYLPEEQLQDAPQVLSALAGKGFESAKHADPNIKTKAWDTKKAPVHHAIIPTGSFKKSMSDMEQKLFGIIAEAYVCQFYPNMRYISQQVIVGLDGQKWKASGTLVTDPGWKRAVKQSSKEKQESGLPDGMRQGDPVDAKDAGVDAKKTQPPKRFTDGTLIDAMGNIHKFVTDPKTKKTLKANSGIGTEATRSNIVETVIKRGYLERKGKNIVSTKLGREVRDKLPPGLCDPGTTAAWEDLLARVEQGELSCDWFVDSVSKVLPQMVAASLQVKFSGEVAEKTYPCPTCNEPLRRFRSKKNKKFYFWACSNKEHPLLRDEKGKPGEAIDFNAAKKDDSPASPCPEDGCDKQMRLRTSKKNPDFKFWACQNQDHPLRKDDNGKPGEVIVFGKKTSRTSQKRRKASGGN
jgi:DNA topoisomerase-3